VRRVLRVVEQEVVRGDGRGDGAAGCRLGGWYFGSPKRCIETPWLSFGEVSNEGRRIFCHHHTVSGYFDAVSSAGLTITSLLEPAPDAEFAGKNAGRYFQAMHVPVFLIFKAERIRK
jgi:hypothetical protein